MWGRVWLHVWARVVWRVRGRWFVCAGRHSAPFVNWQNTHTCTQHTDANTKSSYLRNAPVARRTRHVRGWRYAGRWCFSSRARPFLSLSWLLKIISQPPCPVAILLLEDAKKTGSPTGSCSLHEPVVQWKWCVETNVLWQRFALF